VNKACKSKGRSYS